MRLLLLLLVAAAPASASPPPGPTAWTASWIAVPGEPARTYGVYHFRRTFELSEVPRTFRVHVTGDNRYELFANGRRVVRGPAQGDLENWRYDTVDLAPFLVRGRNVLAAVVFNHAEHAQWAQISLRTGFLLQGDTAFEQALVDTGPSWLALRNAAYEVIPFGYAELKNFFVAGPGERVRAASYPWGWQEPGFDEQAWKPAATITAASAKNSEVTDILWLLVPRPIPLMEERPERLQKARRATGLAVPPGFPAKPAPLRILPRTRAELLLDQTYLTTAYPELVVSGGKGARITLAYAENLWGPGEKDKGHRDEIEGKRLRGNFDEFFPDGGTRRLFSPLWWRTYRYLQVSIETADEPLVLDDLRGVYTVYPFERRARFTAPAKELDQILDVGWRTARLCAHDTYMDCPYYEQIQYVGDTRVQALVSLYMSGDDRLMRNAIAQFNASRVADEPIRSRYPVHTPQYIPAFSLLWIGMLHDHWWYRGDVDFVRAHLSGVRAVLEAFERYRLPSGVVGALPYWGYVDWVPSWPGGVPPGWNKKPRWSQGADPVPLSDPLGSSAIFDLHLVMALRWAADLEKAAGDVALAARHEREAERLSEVVHRLYWDPGKQLFADTAHRQSFSQHASVLAVLAGVVHGAEATALMKRVLADTSLTQSTIYFRYYLHEAMRRAGLADRYLEQLGPWRRMLALGLTTWAETEDPSRSDCHAWGSSPNIELFRTVLGIDAGAPGFRQVRLAPALGALPRASGSIPHPLGEISVSYALRGQRLEADIRLPPGLKGELVWGGQTRPLTPGRSQIVVEPASPAPR